MLVNPGRVKIPASHSIKYRENYKKTLDNSAKEDNIVRCPLHNRYVGGQRKGC
jgi:hypothetical protein